MKQAFFSLILALFLLSGCKTTHDVQYVDRDVVKYVDRLVKTAFIFTIQTL